MISRALQSARRAPLPAQACYLLATLALAVLVALVILSGISSGLGGALGVLGAAPRPVAAAVAFWTLGRICQDVAVLADRTHGESGDEPSLS